MNSNLLDIFLNLNYLVQYYNYLLFFYNASYYYEYKYLYLNITLYGELKHNLGLIIGTVEYQQLIDNIFFNENIKNGICHKNNALINDFNDDNINYTYYYCNNDISFNKTKFPTLYVFKTE